MSAESYTNGYACGEYRKEATDYDPRWDFADAAKVGHEFFADFKRGFEDGFKGKEPTP